MFVQRFAITILLVLCCAEATAAQWRIGLITPPPHRWTQTAQALAEQLQQNTSVDIDLAIFPSGQLGNEAQMLQLLQTGAMDLAFLTTSELVNRLPDFAAFYTPYLATNALQAATILESEVANQILSNVERIGLVGLGFGMAGMRQIVSRGQVTRLADMRGKKVRVVPDKPLTDFWSYANTAPTPIPLSVLYDAFANGQIDAMHIDFENTLRLKLYEHADTIIESNHMMFPMVAVASARSWASLTVNQRRALSNMLTKLLVQLRHAYAAADIEFRDQLAQTGAEQGLEIISVNHDFFGDASQRWFRKWSELTPYTRRLAEMAGKMRSANPQPHSDRNSGD